VTLREVREVALVRVDHLTEVARVQGHRELKLLRELSMEFHKVFRRDAQGRPMLESIELFSQKTLHFVVNLKLRHLSSDLLLARGKVMFPC
jgi:hypothetical protein